MFVCLFLCEVATRWPSREVENAHECVQYWGNREDDGTNWIALPQDCRIVLYQYSIIQA